MVDGSVDAGRRRQAGLAAAFAPTGSRITTLVKTAIGFDEKRGDHVEVVSMRFVTEETAAHRRSSPACSA